MTLPEGKRIYLARSGIEQWSWWLVNCPARFYCAARDIFVVRR
jgi:hypothetical protein